MKLPKSHPVDHPLTDAIGRKLETAILSRDEGIVRVHQSTEESLLTTNPANCPED